MDVMLDLMIKMNIINDKPISHEDNRLKINDWCSNYYKPRKTLLKGEIFNPEHMKRNAYVRLYGFNDSTKKAVLQTSNKYNVYSIQTAVVKNNHFILTSGCGEYVDIFRFNHISSGQVLGIFKFSDLVHLLIF